MKTNINIIGLGFVGLTTALGFASKKNKIICVEKSIKIKFNQKRQSTI